MHMMHPCRITKPLGSELAGGPWPAIVTLPCYPYASHRWFFRYRPNSRLHQWFVSFFSMVGFDGGVAVVAVVAEALKEVGRFDNRLLQQ